MRFSRTEPTWNDVEDAAWNLCLAYIMIDRFGWWRAMLGFAAAFVIALIIKIATYKGQPQ